jgi:hypothetical protein
VAAINFDTLKFADRLKEAGIDAQQAEAQARALAEALGSSDLATKADLSDLKADLIKWIAGLLIAQAALVAALVKLL